MHGYLKSIRLYSDNPIHVSIGRIIDKCTLIDESKGISYYDLAQLHAYVEHLFVTTHNVMAQRSIKDREDMDDE